MSDDKTWPSIREALVETLEECRTEFPHRPVALKASACECTLGEAAIFCAEHGLECIPMPGWGCGWYVFVEPSDG